jgi:transcriptional regulator
MYNPPQFREERVPVLQELIRQHGFATLVTTGADGLTADHLPLELDADRGPFGTLIGHVARANPVWRRRANDADGLAVFHGPQTYISPAWYPTKRESGKVVPTWNYVVVHAHGPIRAIEDRAWLRALVERLTKRYESARPDPWHVADAPEEFIEGLLKGIVGIEMPITRLEGKWKVSQNRPAADRDGVAANLRALGDLHHSAMARLVDDASDD